MGARAAAVNRRMKMGNWNVTEDGEQVLITHPEITVRLKVMESAGDHAAQVRHAEYICERLNQPIPAFDVCAAGEHAIYIGNAYSGSNSTAQGVTTLHNISTGSDGSAQGVFIGRCIASGKRK